MSDTPMSSKIAAGNVATGLLIVLILSAVLWMLFQPGSTTKNQVAVVAEPSEKLEPSQAPFETLIRKPQGLPTVSTGLKDAEGKAVTVNCNTCHATKPPNSELRVGTSLTLFHQGMKGLHGNLTCISCHNPSDGYQSLRLADGKQIAFPDVMQLCAQCHGPQFRDYQHGAHGGMTGYWDLTKGPRQRNNCIDCHDPHAPKYPQVRPSPGPQDRHLVPAHKQGAGHG